MITVEAVGGVGNVLKSICSIPMQMWHKWSHNKSSVETKMGRGENESQYTVAVENGLSS